MVHYALVFFTVALVAAVFGFSGIAGGTAEIAKIVFGIFAALFLGLIVGSALRRMTPERLSQPFSTATNKESDELRQDPFPADP